MSVVEIWAQANETLTAVAWPVIVAGVALGFRKQIGDRIRNVRRAKGIGVEIDFDESREAKELTASLKDGVENVVIGALSGGSSLDITGQANASQEDDHATAEGQVGSAGPAQNPRAREDRRLSLLDLRDDIESIIRSSWGSGFDAGRSGMYPQTSEPVPMIEWRGAVPEVVGFGYPGHRGPWIIASGDARAAAHKNREEAIARRDAGLNGFVVRPDELLRNARGAKRNNIAALEDEIRLLVHSDQGTKGSATNNKARAVLAQLQYELSQLDPGNTWATEREI